MNHHFCRLRTRTLAYPSLSGPCAGNSLHNKWSYSEAADSRQSRTHVSFLNLNQHFSVPPRALRVHGVATVSPHSPVFSARPMFMRVALCSSSACVRFKNTSAPTVNRAAQGCTETGWHWPLDADDIPDSGSEGEQTQFSPSPVRSVNTSFNWNEPKVSPLIAFFLRSYQRRSKQHSFCQLNIKPAVISGILAWKLNLLEKPIQMFS